MRCENGGGRVKLINAETLITVLEEQKKRAVGYEHSVLEQVIKTIRMMPEVDQNEERAKLP